MASNPTDPSEPELNEAEKQATAIRAVGNDLYKKGKIFEASQEYMKACKLTPLISVPWRNLSGAAYELGNYKYSIAVASKALRILEKEKLTEEEKEMQRKKLKTRIEKARLHLLDVDVDVDVDVDSNVTKIIERKKILQRIGRYRESMFGTTEYFTVGHDIVTSLFDEQLFQLFAPEQEQINFFLAGVSDARNLLQTFAVVAELEGKGRVKERRYHFLVNDVQKSALGRDLLVWCLLDELSGLEEGEESELVLNSLFFVYLGTLMPGFVFERVLRTMGRLIGVLKRGEQPLKWAFLHERDFGAYIEALEYWSGKAREMFGSGQIMNKVSIALWRKGTLMPDSQGQFEKEKELYTETAILYPSSKILQTYDSELKDLLDGYRMKPKDAKVVEQLERKVEESWVFNTTLMDAQWIKDLDNQDVGFDPFESAIHFPYDEVSTKPANPDRLYEHMAPFFIDAAKAIKFLEGRVMVEAIIGDYADVAEKISFGLFADESEGKRKKREWRPKEFPVLFDRIHLSNVPDYMHGHLSTFLYAFPLLRRSPAANIRANCLRNSSTFPTVLSYLSEYALIPSEDVLSKLFQVLVLVSENNELPYPMADYSIYTYSTLSAITKFTDLLPRKQFEHWFISLFFRLALPMQQNIQETHTVVLSPLNLSILFRLIPHMIKLGYPAHWLSGLLSSLLSGTITTTARPPRSKPIPPSQASKQWPLKKLTVKPFVHELRTLTKLFSSFLLFQFPEAGEGGVVKKYTFSIPGFENLDPRPTCLILVFFHTMLFVDRFELLGRMLKDLREVLDPEGGDGDGLKELREKGVVVFTGFEWDSEAKVAGVWVEEGWVREMVGDGMWSVGIWRSDTWERCFRVPADVGREPREGGDW